MEYSRLAAYSFYLTWLRADFDRVVSGLIIMADSIFNYLLLLSYLINILTLSCLIPTIIIVAAYLVQRLRIREDLVLLHGLHSEQCCLSLLDEETP